MRTESLTVNPLDSRSSGEGRIHPHHGQPNATEVQSLTRAMVSVREVLAYLDHDRYLSKSDAAEYLGLSVSNIEKQLQSIPHFRVGAKVLFRKSELNSWMERHREDSKDLDLDRIADEAVRAVLGTGKNR
jgi:excisionase family DNA binding protein